MVFAACSSKEEAEVAPETDVQTQSQLPANHPPLSGTEIKYSAPEGWIAETPSGSMRKAQYKPPGVEGKTPAELKDPAELAVFHFPGTGGSVEANFNRWYGQFKQPDGGSTQERAETKSVMATELPVTIVYATGTYLKSSSPMAMDGPVEELPGYALLAAIVETANGPWFFKTTGPQETIDYWRPEFEKFAETIHF
jgi:hypothetical protein